MSKMKKSRIVKYHGGEKYVFIGGKAKVPSFSLGKNEPVIVTFKEFNELIKEVNIDVC